MPITFDQYNLTVHPDLYTSGQWMAYLPVSSTTIRTDGWGTVPVQVGTVSTVQPVATIPMYWNQVTAASLSATASTTSLVTGQWRRGAATDVVAGMGFESMLYFPDASYNQSAATTGTRIWTGFASAATATLLGTDRGTVASQAGFWRCSVNGGSIDTNWQFVNADASTKSVVDTGCAWVAQHVYAFHIWIPAGAGTIYWSIDDKTAGTTFAGVNGSNLPAATTLHYMGAGMLTIDAVARNFGVQYLYARNDRG